MQKEVPQYILDKLDFNEDKIRECLREIREIRSEIMVSNTYIPEIERLLSDEKYRILLAISKSKNKKEAYRLLNMNERTFYRKIRKYKIT